MKKMNNKGFSLVELIIVIAIMAILIAVLAPQYLRYVEKSRLQSDNSAIGEVCNAIKVAVANDAIASEVGSGGQSITFSSNPALVSFTGTSLLNDELSNVVGSVQMKSNTYKNGTMPGASIGLDSTTHTLEVYAVSYMSEVNGTPTNTKF
jgi:type IV pilus assembly protein PilA